MSRVREILQDRQIFYVLENDCVASVVQRMAELKVGAILVLGDADLCGIFSERDLMRRVVLEKLDPETTLVKAVMTTEVAVIDECATLEEAMESMTVHACRHLPVTREGKVIGLLSMRDLMYFELARKTEEWQMMRSYIQQSA
jgi:signal-transduction protein with cAMP-binding, CBS, and nucleotidyltransferase domain